MNPLESGAAFDHIDMMADLFGEFLVWAIVVIALGAAIGWFVDFIVGLLSGSVLFFYLAISVEDPFLNQIAWIVAIAIVMIFSIKLVMLMAGGDGS